MTYVLAVMCVGSACDPTGAGAGYEPPPTVRADATWRAGPPPADRFALDPNSDEFIEATEGDAIEPDRYALVRTGAWLPLEDLLSGHDDVEWLTVETHDRGFRGVLWECEVILVLPTECIILPVPCPSGSGPGSESGGGSGPGPGPGFPPDDGPGQPDE